MKFLLMHVIQNPNSNDPFIYINQEQDLFDFGLKNFENLYDCTIHVCYSHDDFQQNINSVNYHQFIDHIQVVFLGHIYIIFLRLMRNQKHGI